MKTLKQIADDIHKLIETCKQHDEFVLNSRQDYKLLQDGSWIDENAQTLDRIFLNDIGKYLSALNYLDNKTMNWLTKDFFTNPDKINRNESADIQYYLQLLEMIDRKIKQGYGEKELICSH